MLFLIPYYNIAIYFNIFRYGFKSQRLQNDGWNEVYSFGGAAALYLSPRKLDYI